MIIIKLIKLNLWHDLLEKRKIIIPKSILNEVNFYDTDDGERIYIDHEKLMNENV